MLWKRGCVLGLQVCGLGSSGLGLGIGLGGCGLVNITAPIAIENLTNNRR